GKHYHLEVSRPQAVPANAEEHDEDDDEDDNESDTDDEYLTMDKIDAAYPGSRRTEEESERLGIQHVPNLKEREKLAKQMIHAESCKKWQCTDDCPVGLLDHIKYKCKAKSCIYIYCKFAAKLRCHYKKCNPVEKQCPFCFTWPEYKGKDHFAEMKVELLSKIVGHLKHD
ncbi:hypothetical protein PMAYCL1PPCAC_10280, partial [Pristionchus mayeri]